MNLLRRVRPAIDRLCCRKPPREVDGVVNDQFRDISSEQEVRVKALYDFEPLQSGDLEFRRGDVMIVERSNMNDDWWEARHVTTNDTGLIPSTYVVIDNEDEQYQPWWFDLERREAEKLLMLPGNKRGTFLIRPSRDGRSSVLSVRNFDESTNDLDIKHYRINRSNQLYYIARSNQFATIRQLVDHYRADRGGLCHILVNSCPKQPGLMPFRNIEVNRSEIQLGNMLGSGKFGEVFKGKWRNRLDVAVKQLTPAHMSTEAFLQEAQVLHKLRHRRIVLLFGVCTTEEPMYIIMEFLPKGALLDYLRKGDGKKLDYPVLIDFAVQVADGMAFLEKSEYVHRDLRAANVLVDDNETVKIADLGLARCLDESVYNASNTTQFPVKWTAIEAVEKLIFTTKTDVWSFGILLYEIITYGKAPYIGMTNREAVEEVRNGFRMKNPECPGVKCSDKLYQVMRSCWEEDPEKRPTFASLYEFFNKYAEELDMPYSDTDFQEDILTN